MPFGIVPLKKNTMKNNIGNIDRIIRLLLAAVLITLFLANAIDGWLNYLLLAFSGVLILTSLMRFCPLYPIIGINTCQKKNKDS